MQKLPLKTLPLGTIIRITTAAVFVVAVVLITLLAITILRTLDHISSPPTNTDTTAVRSEGVNEQLLNDLIKRQSERTAPTTASATVANPFAIIASPVPAPVVPVPSP